MKEEKELLESASYWLTTAISIFNGSEGLNSDPKVDKYLRMVECADKIQDYLNSRQEVKSGDVYLVTKEQLNDVFNYGWNGGHHGNTITIEQAIHKSNMVLAPTQSGLNKEEIIEWIKKDAMFDTPADSEFEKGETNAYNRVINFLLSLSTSIKGKGMEEIEEGRKCIKCQHLFGYQELSRCVGGGYMCNSCAGL